MERSKVIEHLQQLKCDYTNYWEETHDEMTDALDIAIADIKKLEEIEQEVKQLQNRCAVLSKGLLCQFCNMECESRIGDSVGADDGTK